MNTCLPVQESEHPWRFEARRIDVPPGDETPRGADAVPRYAALGCAPSRPVRVIARLGVARRPLCALDEA